MHIYTTHNTYNGPEGVTWSAVPPCAYAYVSCDRVQCFDITIAPVITLPRSPTAFVEASFVPSFPSESVPPTRCHIYQFVIVTITIIAVAAVA